MSDQLLIEKPAGLLPTETPAMVGDAEDKESNDVFYIDEIDTVPVEILMSMRC